MGQAHSAQAPAVIFGYLYTGEFVPTDLSICIDNKFDKVMGKTEMAKHEQQSCMPFQLFFIIGAFLSTLRNINISLLICWQPNRRQPFCKYKFPVPVYG
jgi:hypothetical protein